MIELDRAEESFLLAWLAGDRTRTTASLLDQAEAAGLALNGKTRNGRLVSLGMWIGNHASQQLATSAGPVVILPAGIRSGYQRYQIQQHRPTEE